MSAREDSDAAKAGFVNPFDGEAGAAVPTSGPAEGQVSPQKKRSLAKDTALKEDVAPADTAQLAEVPVRGNNAQVAFAETGPGTKDASSSHDIEKISTHSAPESNSSSSHGNIAGEALDKIKTTATRVADKFRLSNVRVSGPLRLFNPTNVRARLKRSSDPDSDLDLLWRSRDNRKGRGSIAVRSSLFEDPATQRKPSRTQRASVHAKHIAQNVKRMFTTFPYWDMAFWGGWSYTIGSALFVLDGAFAWIPAAFPKEEFKDEEKYGVPLCFFFGAIFFQIGATMAYFEAINDGSFHGSAMRRLMEGHEEDQKKMLDEKIHAFFGSLHPHHKDPDEEAAQKLAAEVDPEAGWRTKDRKERPGSIYPPEKHPGRRRRGAMDMGEAEEGQSSTYLTWRWWPR